ncbi:MAG: ThuA domain-containing protein [Mariniblastus sp.]|nr:ThuA domain-containing protein [Mariniblastus sp.]
MLKFITILATAMLFPQMLFSQVKSNGENTTLEKPLRALLICGGCCHDYTEQHKVLSDGIQSRANIRVDVWWTDDKSTNPPLTVYDNVNWANGYDVIIHDECAARNTNVEVLKRILKVHEKTPAVHLHCAMHSFRNGTDLWFKHLGLQSTGHGPHEPIDVKFVDKDHPVVQGMEDWTIEKDELYNNAKLFGAKPIATGTQTYERKGKINKQDAIVIWSNEVKGTRSFSMSIGHYTEGVADDRYLDLVTRGILWACKKDIPKTAKGFTGKNTITFVEKKKAEESKPKQKQAKAPKNPTLVAVTSSTVQSGHDPAHCLDQQINTRWCASDASYPQWIELEFQKPQSVKQIKIDWERNSAYQYRVLTEIKGKMVVALDHSKSQEAITKPESLPSEMQLTKKIRIEGLGCSSGGWCSIREIKLSGAQLKNIWPADKNFNSAFEPTPAPKPDPYKKQGNAPAKMVPLTPQQEAAILKEVTIPEGFEATIFAAPPAVNYPVFVAAAPDGTLYVSSDGNGSLGRDPQRGRVIRLKDTDGDGRADETKIFCEVDSPRGLIWDHDRLYLVHPPHLSEFIDDDKDGVADRQNILVSNLAFGYDKRPADHTTNGLSLGVDGYLYIAGGDFGFMKAEGTDGTTLTHRGGGVIRVRPDGTGLELYSTGTRNILEVAVSPEMDLFARDNTNDGGGWDVRFHHFTGGDDHGYPRLYKNFADECIPPLADYGGGSGCGAAYVDEPGFGQWNHAPFTADWGTGGIYHHSVSPIGATFKETEKPKAFVKLPRPTDCDVDGMSRLYCSSWKGATFKWAGPQVGYIVQVKPKDYVPKPLPDFETLTPDQLVQLFDSPSHRRRLAAQRELMRRENPASQKLIDRGVATWNTPRRTVHQIQNTTDSQKVISAISHRDPTIQHVAIRETAKRNLLDLTLSKLDSVKDPGNLYRALGMMHRSTTVRQLEQRLTQSNEQHKKLILKTLCRLYFKEAAWEGQSWGTRPDTRGPYYQPVKWEETENIHRLLMGELQTCNPKVAAYLMNELAKNRVDLTDSIDQIVTLATSNPELTEPAVSVLVKAKKLTPASIEFLISSVGPNLPITTLKDVVSLLTRTNDPKTIPIIFMALDILNDPKHPRQYINQTRDQFFNSNLCKSNLQYFADNSLQIGNSGFWADCALLTLATQKNLTAEDKTKCSDVIRRQCLNPQSQCRIVSAATYLKNHSIDDFILASLKSDSQELAQSAKTAAKKLNLTMLVDRSAKLGSLDAKSAVDQAMQISGDRGHGETIFIKSNCIACHTTKITEKQKGPYLGNITKTYRPHELAMAILRPNQSIAQGFKTNIILDLDGRLVSGYVTEESADQVVLRDQEGKEFTFKKDDIDSRKESKLSSMPENILEKNTLFDLASLISYLEHVSQQSDTAGN